jgi:hypothetical protein
MTGRAGSFWVAKPKTLKAAKQKPGELGFCFLRLMLFYFLRCKWRNYIQLTVKTP